MKWIVLAAQLVAALSGLVPGGPAYVLMANALMNVLKAIQTQTDLTTEELLERMGNVLDETEKMLLEDLVRLGVLNAET